MQTEEVKRLAEQSTGRARDSRPKRDIGTRTNRVDGFDVVDAGTLLVGREFLDCEVLCCRAEERGQKRAVARVPFTNLNHRYHAQKNTWR